jgi:hypothetical protein
MEHPPKGERPNTEESRRAGGDTKSNREDKSEASGEKEEELEIYTNLASSPLPKRSLYL